MFSLVDEGIIQYPSLHDCDKLELTTSYILYICIYMVHGLTQSTWQSSQHTTI